MAAFFAREENFGQLIKQPPSPPTNPSESAAVPAKKKRNLPGYQKDPDAEVIALSPKTLMATNRFVCEVCNKGFQREQNLQLHRRGHNLPWKLKQKSTKEVRRKVYLCPEPTCVHHEPSRALGDLTGIKKHFCRKHGEKKWKCDKCDKRYAVQSDWKAHSKTCGTREYRCDCGTLFSRRDSFITHRAFCDALAQESERLPPTLTSLSSHLYGNGNTTSNNNSTNIMGGLCLSSLHDVHPQFDPLRSVPFPSSSSATAFYSSAPNFTPVGPTQLPDLQTSFNVSSHTIGSEPLYPLPQMSATALLQKAALMGATTSDGNGGSFALASSSGGLQNFLMNLLAGGHAGTFGPGIGIGTGTDGLTRDFLGVGSVMRGMVNGAGQHNGGVDIGALGSEHARSGYSGLP